MSLNWDGAACLPQDGRLFFGADNEPVRTQMWRERTATAICIRCPLQLACLDYALTEQIQHGVWGGMTEAGRANMLRRRRKKAYRERQKVAA